MTAPNSHVHKLHPHIPPSDSHRAATVSGGVTSCTRHVQAAVDEECAPPIQERTPPDKIACHGMSRGV